MTATCSTPPAHLNFGKAKDEDGDGVPDRKDKCPATPSRRSRG